jgi:tetratricopeptide (TPR) repeat protein
MENQTLSFKIFFQNSDNIRRFRMETRPTYQQFVEFLLKLYSPLYHPELRLQYTDSEDDKIFVTSQIEWEEMFEELKDDKIIKLSLVEGQKPYFKDGPEPTCVRAYDDPIGKKPIALEDPNLENRVTQCLKLIFPSNKIIPTNIPTFLEPAICPMNISGCEAELDIDVNKLSQVLFREGYNLLEKKEYAKGRNIYQALLVLDPHHQLGTYNLACAEALLGNETPALRYLENAVRLGYRDARKILEDTDLESLHNHPKFVQIIETLQPQTKTQPELQIPQTQPQPQIQPQPQPQPQIQPQPQPQPQPQIQPEPQIQPQPQPQIQPEPQIQPQPLPQIQPQPQPQIQPQPLPQIPPLLQPQIQPQFQPQPQFQIQPEYNTQSHQKWVRELDVLHDIGYFDDDILVAFLESTKGNVQQTVLKLLDI